MSSIDPIDCQRFASLAGARYNCTDFQGQPGPVYYCTTHSARRNFQDLRTKGRCVLVTSGSDQRLTGGRTLGLPDNIVRWFSTNVTTTHSRVTAIPIGFIFNSERTRLILEGMERGSVLHRRNLMLINFSCHTPERGDLYQRFGTAPWVTLKGGQTHDDVRQEEYYEDVAAHNFVLSPPGAGPDCHRHWEAMALWSIPVVLRSQATAIMDDLPCLQLSTWDELSPGLLEQAWQDLLPRFRSPAMAKLSFDYWERQIWSSLDG